MNTLAECKEDYLKCYKEQGCKFIVLKMEDLMKSINDWPQWVQLQSILVNYNNFRQSIGKGINKYYVINRDECPNIKSGDDFVNLLHKINDNYEEISRTYLG
jgi:hypothetical protein